MKWKLLFCMGIYFEVISFRINQLLICPIILVTSFTSYFVKPISIRLFYVKINEKKMWKQGKRDRTREWHGLICWPTSTIYKFWMGTCLLSSMCNIKNCSRVYINATRSGVRCFTKKMKCLGLGVVYRLY